jgi:hypothetical protein
VEDGPLWPSLENSILRGIWREGALRPG